MDVIMMESTVLGAIGFALMSVVSAILKKHRRGMVFGVSSMVSYMLFAWLWYSAFTHHGGTWLELAFRIDSRGFKINITFLVCGLVLTFVNMLGIIRQRELNLSASSATN